MSEIFAVTDRLILRDYRPADLPHYIELSADPETYAGTKPLTIEWD